MIKNFVFLLALFCSSIAWSQKVFFNHMEKVHDNNEKIFYRLPQNFDEAEYLGELEIQGFSNDDVEVFSKVYAKAKEIGANTFAYSPIPSVDGTVQKFDPWNYRLKLFYYPQKNIPTPENVAIIFGSPVNDTKMVINRKKIDLPMRSYIKQPLAEGASYRLGTGNLLGSTVMLTGKLDQSIQYFQIGGPSMRGEGGFLNFKSGDIVLLERSYADFLTVIYTELSIKN